MVALRIFLSDSQVTTVTLHLQDDGSSVNVHINLQATTQVSGFANLIQTIQTVMSFFLGGGRGLSFKMSIKWVIVLHMKVNFSVGKPCL